MRGVSPMQMIRLVADAQEGVVTAGQCRQAGVSPDAVQRLCRSRRWLRLSRGAYLVDAEDLREPPRPALIRAALLSAGPAAVAVLDSAADIHGIAGIIRRPSTPPEDGAGWNGPPAFTRPGPAAVVHLSLRGSLARPRRICDPTIRLHQFTLGPDEVVAVDGVLVTTPVRTLADLLLRVDRYTGVSLVDSALSLRLITPDQLADIRASMARRRGAVRATPWLAEADGRAESPLETRVRLRAVDGHIKPDELQYRIVDRSGYVVAIADLAWTGWRIIGEADGVDAHDNPEAVFRDRTRQNAIVAAGFVPVRFTWADTTTPECVPRLIRAAINRAA